MLLYESYFLNKLKYKQIFFEILPYNKYKIVIIKSSSY